MKEKVEKARKKETGENREGGKARTRKGEKSTRPPGEQTRTIFQPHKDLPDTWEYLKDKSGYHITGRRIEQITNMTDTRNMDAMARLYDILDKRGMLKVLINNGWDVGKPLWIGKHKIHFDL